MLLYVAGFWMLLTAVTAMAWSTYDGARPLRPALSEPEIGVATMLMSAAVLTVLLRPAFATRYDGIDWKMAAIDVLLVVGLVFHAAGSGRWWVICATALQLISTTAHMARAVTPGMWRLGYQVMEEASSYPTILLVGWGVLARYRRTRRDARSNSSSDARPRTRTRRKP